MTNAVPHDDVDGLKEEVSRLQARLDRRAAWSARLRRGSLVLLLVLGCGLAGASVIAAYVRATVLDTDRYVETMAPIAESPSVQRAVADKLDTAINGRVDFDALIREALPERADVLAPALASGLSSAISTRIDGFVASDDFPRLWNEANRRAHSRVVALLTTGESKRLLLEGDTVSLDLGAAVERVRAGLRERGFDRLADAIPADVDGRIPLLQSDGFTRASGAIDRLERLTILLPILALLCFAGHVALSRPRRRGVLRAALGLAVVALLLLALVGLARSAYLDAIDQQVLPRQAAADIFDALIVLLRSTLRVVAIAAIVIALLSVVAGHSGAIAARSRAAVAGFATDRRTSWVAEHRALLQGAAVGLGALVLLSWDPPTATVVLIDAALVAGAVALVAGIARSARA